MNKFLNKILALITLVFVMTMTGCLKDSDYSDNINGTKNTQNQNFVEVHLTSSDNTNLVARAYSSMDRDTTITKLIPINLTSGPAGSDVTVTFALLDTTNSEIVKSLVVDEGLVVPDPATFTVVNTGNKVIIPAGQSTGYVSVKFKPSDLLGSTFIFGIKITAVSDAKYTISNLDKGYVKLIIKNQWDGLYSDAGYFKHPTLGTTTFDYTGIEFGTVGATTLEKSNAGDRGIPTDVTITSNTMVVNGATVYKVTIAVVGYPGSAAGQVDVDPDGNPMNYYNPATKTFELFYWYNSAAHRVIRETLVYEGPR